jgi:hypothetical protein
MTIKTKIKNILKVFKKDKDVIKEKVSFITAITFIEELIKSNDNKQSIYKKINNYLFDHEIRGYNPKEYEFFYQEIHTFFKNIIPFILIDEKSFLLQMILEKITHGRDDHLMHFLSRNPKVMNDILETHINVNSFLLVLPSKSFFYETICKNVNGVNFNNKKTLYIDIIIFLRKNAFFNNNYVRQHYLGVEKRETSIEDFDNNLNIYVKNKKLKSKIGNF